ncbi:hypothetical protein CEB3_c50840 [Peptococcaceae bacterium CEB3]|nr:hypothetical protein CEB3_c50840 [Peptococcaceae bacterium CEB3]
MRKAGEPCILEYRICTECGECDRCELNPDKICDNCCECLDEGADYLEVKIDDILISEEKPKHRGGRHTYRFRNRPGRQ